MLDAPHAPRQHPAGNFPSFFLSFFLSVVLKQGVFLPHIASFTYTDVNITIHKVRNKTFKLLPAVLDLKEAWEQC